MAPVKAAAGNIAPVATLAFIDDPAVAAPVNIALIVLDLLPCVIAGHYIIRANFWGASDAKAIYLYVIGSLLGHYARG